MKDLIDIENLERQIYDLVTTNRYKIVFVILFSSVVILFSLLPYINLYLSREMVPMIILVVILGVFNINTHDTIFLGLGLFMLAFLLYLINKMELVETIGNYIFAILLISILREIIHLAKFSPKD